MDVDFIIFLNRACFKYRLKTIIHNEKYFCPLPFLNIDLQHSVFSEKCNPSFESLYGDEEQECAAAACKL
jgi:hypothetical protein